MKVVVIGSSNIDMVAQVSHLPAPGETVGDANFMQSLGGKGANQAVAAARLGGFVTFVTSLGNDMYADILKNHFKKEGITTACLIDEELMKAIDILVVNELEASFISGIDYTDNNLEEIAETLLKAGTSNVVITLGSQGAYMKNAKETIQLPGCKVNAIDTIAAGDTFCGALAVVCAKKEIDREALNFANTAAAIAVTRSGAQPSIPTLDEVKHFMLEKELALSFNF